MINLVDTWVGIASLIVFLIGYYFITAEEKYQINKAKPSLFMGTFMFFLIGIYFVQNNLDNHLLGDYVRHLILEISEIFFFLVVAMTFIESLIERNIFGYIKHWLIVKGFSYKQLFWITGAIAFFLSPVADNLTTSLILATVLISLDKDNKKFLIPSAINIVVAANAGGSWSPFGDVTSLMLWTSGKAAFQQFLLILPAALGGWLLTAFLLSLYVPKGKVDVPEEELSRKVEIKEGGKKMALLGIITISLAVVFEQFFHMPAMFGMMFGLALLKLYAIHLRKIKKENFNIYFNMKNIETDTLFFFFGILSAVGALHFLGYLSYLAVLYDLLPHTLVNTLLGILSAFVDNIPLMSTVIKSNLSLGVDQWLLAALTIGTGGSLISFGSAAGVSVMSKLKGIYTFAENLKLSWTILVGYLFSIIIWYVQFHLF